MKITNNSNLPEPIINAIKKHSHKGGFVSASGMTISPREYWIKHNHKGEIAQDANEMIWALFGTALHNILEKGEGKDGIAEAYMEAEVLGEKVTGTADYYENGVISDWKTDSVYTIIYGSREVERELQLNVYAYLFRKSGFKVNEIKIVSLLKDWSRTKARFDASYPQAQVLQKSYRIMEDQEIEGIIESKIKELKSFENTELNELPFCSDEYRWKDPEKFAVMKKGKKRAIKLHLSEESAKEHTDSLGTDHYIEHRKSEARKCKDYCNAYPFCNQAQGEYKND